MQGQKNILIYITKKNQQESVIIKQKIMYNIVKKIDRF
jgi:hypothetical protein